MKHIVIGTAGHIDHGKSSLVLALTGTDPDRLKEEKDRGITIDLGFAHWEAPGLSVAFIDVPGHERFVKNMLAGVGGLDAVMLVVAADESVMPQTREHFAICRLLQVPAGLVVLTKVDAVEREMIDLVRADVQELVAGSFLDGAPMLPVSARTGEGLDALRAALREIGAAAAGRREDGPARLPVDRVFSMRGFGTVVTGTLVTGGLEVESAATVLPGDRPVKVRGLQVHGARVPRAVAGQRVAVNLGGVDTADVLRGQTIAPAGAFSSTRVVDVRIELLGAAKGVRHGARLRFHQGTSEVLGRVAVSSLVADGERGGGEARVVRRDSARAIGLRPAAARGPGGGDARRPLHRASLLAARHDWRRTRARSRSRPGAASARRRARPGSRNSIPRRRQASSRRLSARRSYWPPRPATPACRARR